MTAKPVNKPAGWRERPRQPANEWIALPNTALGGFRFLAPNTTSIMNALAHRGAVAGAGISAA